MKWVLVALVLGVFELVDVGGNNRLIPFAQAEDSQCHTVVETFKILPTEEHVPHVPLCSPVNYPTHPPTSGRHYRDWAQYKTYSIPVPHGFTVHNLEHGAIVISYNCPE